MKPVTLDNYMKDVYYPKIVRATQKILAAGDVIAPCDLFVKMDLLNAKALEDWRFGRVAYLEKVIHCNLSKADRILRLLRFHAHDLKLKPSQTVYKKWGKGRKHLLRFSASGNTGVEEAYSRHFVRLGKHAHRQPALAADDAQSADAESDDKCGG